MRLLPPSRVARVLPALVAATALTVTVLPSYAADPGAPAAAPAAAPEDEQQQSDEQVAEEALAAAQDLVEGTSDADPTLVLAQLNQTLADLPEDSDKREARAILARPTRGGDYDGILEYTVEEADPYCLPRLCVHYVRTSGDAPSLTDRDDDGVPNWVELVAETVDHVWEQEIGGLGYPVPPADGNRGGNGKLDVYIGDVGRFGYFGYATPEGSGSRVASYLVLDDDYRPGQFGTSQSRADFLRVTAAHEFFHVVQFGMDALEDTWFMESTATWMEERVYDDINDNRAYLPGSALQRPGRSLDFPADALGTVYGNWIFFEYLSQRFGVEAVRNIWSRATTGGVYSIQAVAQELGARGLSLRDQYAAFAAANLNPGQSYEEGRSYDPPAVAQTLRLESGGTGWRSTPVNHLASQTISFRPGATPARSVLRLKVDGPSRFTRAVVVVTAADGSLVRRAVPVDADGAGTLRARFGSSEVRRVTLTLVNTSTRYECRRGSFSCSGRALDDRKPVTWAARVIR